MQPKREETHDQEISWEVTLRTGEVVQYRGHTARERGGRLEFCDQRGEPQESLDLAGVSDWHPFQAIGE